MYFLMRCWQESFNNSCAVVDLVLIFSKQKKILFGSVWDFNIVKNITAKTL